MAYNSYGPLGAVGVARNDREVERTAADVLAADGDV